MRNRSWLGVLVVLSGLCLAADVRLAWDPNVEPVAGYVVHRGTASGSYDYTQTTKLAQIVLPTVLGKTNYFAVRAFDTNGLLSGFSNEVFLFVPGDEPPPPPPPGKPPSQVQGLALLRIHYP